jgi:hypothetical protein
MACLQRRCPCWPRAEPFDATEMDLLFAVTQYMQSVDSEKLWAHMQTQSAAVRRHRLAYVLSTFIQHATYDVTLLGWVSSIYRERIVWLLDIGVCPNMAAVWGGHGLVLRGWRGGPAHPGRPLQEHLSWCSPFVHASSPDVEPLLLAAGAYPVPRGFYRPGQSVATMQRRWQAWHGRALRRLWAALAPHV